MIPTSGLNKAEFHKHSHLIQLMTGIVSSVDIRFLEEYLVELEKSINGGLFPVEIGTPEFDRYTNAAGVIRAVIIFKRYTDRLIKDDPKAG